MGSGQQFKRGNVGIGTTGPSYPLHIVSSGTATGLVVTRVDGLSRAFALNTMTDGSWAMYDYVGSAWHQGLAQNNGNLGIGTTSPNGKLDVNGTIYQRGAKLYADYVFESDYELESIEEHSAYMWQNKHLKAIPKTMVDETGQEMLEIGAHRKGIVEELEKAHVYIRQLNERIKLLEARIRGLEG